MRNDLFLKLELIFYLFDETQILALISNNDYHIEINSSWHV